MGLTCGVAGRPPRAFGLDRVDILFGAESADGAIALLLDTVCKRVMQAHLHPAALTHAHINCIQALITVYNTALLHLTRAHIF